MKQYVCVRIVQANRLNLKQFQFDFDLTFAVFLMNADGTIYGRYGTRSSRKEAERDISTSGLAAAMEGALALHKQYPRNKSSLKGKQAKPTAYNTPNDYPMLRGKYRATLNYQRGTARSCLHCHQIHGAQQAVYRNAGKPVPDELIYFYPMPEVVGLKLNPATRATVKSVEAQSSAADAGFKVGDEITSLDGQSILSIADVQWVLHHAGSKGQLAVEVQRGGKTKKLTLELKDGWRSQTDVTWRAGAWPLRRMGLGGLSLVGMTDEERKRAGLNKAQLGLKVKQMGRFGPFATARRAGFRLNDIIVSFNGVTDAMTPGEMLAYTVQKLKAGRRVPVVVLRGARRVRLTLPMQR